MNPIFESAQSRNYCVKFHPTILGEKTFGSMTWEMSVRQASVKTIAPWPLGQRYQVINYKTTQFDFLRF